MLKKSVNDKLNDFNKVGKDKVYVCYETKDKLAIPRQFIFGEEKGKSIIKSYDKKKQ